MFDSIVFHLIVLDLQLDYDTFCIHYELVLYYDFLNLYLYIYPVLLLIFLYQL